MKTTWNIMYGGWKYGKWKMDCRWGLFLHSTPRSWLLSWSLTEFWCSLDDDWGHFRTLLQAAMFLSESSFLSFYHEMISSLYNPNEQDINWEGKWLHCYYFRFKSRFFCPFLPRSFNFIMSGNSVTCIKLHLFTTDWTWTYDCSPVLYHSTSLSVNLLWNSNCKAFGKSTFFVFKRNIGVFSV